MYATEKWSDVVTITSGKNQKAVVDEHGEYPIYGSGGIMGYASDYLCEAGTTIVGRKGTINKPIFVNRRFWNVDTAFGITPGEQLNPKYLYYFCQHFNFTELDKSTTIPSLAKRDLLAIEMPVPPLEEQQRIVARIEELFSQLDDAEATLQKTKAQLALYRQAVYASAYKGMTADHSIVEYFEIAGGITKNATRSSLRLKRPYLRVANVYYNRLDLSDIKEIGITKAEVEKCTLAKNDLLFVEGNGSQSQIGRVAIWDGSIPDIVHQNHIIKGRPNGSMLPEFALFYLISAEGRKQITEVAKSTSGLYTLSTDKVRKLKIPYCSIEAQRDIIDEIDERLSMCDSIEETILKVLTQIMATKQAILKQAFQN